jgi:hypothetical protein
MAEIHHTKKNFSYIINIYFKILKTLDKAYDDFKELNFFQINLMLGFFMCLR